MPKAPATRKKWALYVYMCGDVPEPGMHRAAQNNLHQMLRAGSSDEVAVVAQIAQPDRFTYRYAFPARPAGTGPVSIEPVDVIETVNSASPAAVLDFVAWASEEYPAEQIMLVLWGHGFGLDYYVPSEFGVQELVELSKSVSFTGRSYSNSMFGVEQAAVTSHPDQGWSFGVDDQARAVLNNNQIGDVLRTIASTLPQGQRLAIVGFDACAMGMVEVWSELFGLERTIGIASEAGLPYLSWPYDTFLRKLAAEAPAGATHVAKILETCFDDYYAKHPTQYVTLSTCSLEKLTPLQTALKLLVDRLIELTAERHVRDGIFAARNYSPEYDEQGFIDLGCFVSNLTIALPDAGLDKLCDAVHDAIRSFVLGNTYSPKPPVDKPTQKKKISQSTGVSVWFPQWIQYADADAIEKGLGEAYLTRGYRSTKFAAATGWDEFLSYLREWAWGLEDTQSKRTGLTPMQRAAEDLKTTEE